VSVDQPAELPGAVESDNPTSGRQFALPQQLGAGWAIRLRELLGQVWRRAMKRSSSTSRISGGNPSRTCSIIAAVDRLDTGGLHTEQQAGLP
jgi:hypothetical protein